MNKSQTGNQELTFQKIRRDQKEMPALLELRGFFNNNLRRKNVVSLVLSFIISTEGLDIFGYKKI